MSTRLIPQISFLLEAFIAKGDESSRHDLFAAIDSLANRLACDTLLAKETGNLRRWTSALSVAFKLASHDGITIDGTPSPADQGQEAVSRRFGEIMSHMAAKNIPVPEEAAQKLLSPDWETVGVSYDLAVRHMPALMAALRPSRKALREAAGAFVGVCNDMLPVFWTAGLEVDAPSIFGLSLLGNLMTEGGGGSVCTIDFLLAHGADPVLALRQATKSDRLIEELRKRLSVPTPAALDHAHPAQG